MANSAIPPYFSWLVDRLLAISAHPFHHTHLRYLVDNGIHTVVSIDEEPPFHTKPQLKVLSLSVAKEGTPTVYECQQFVALMDSAKKRHEAVLVHSTKGIGRSAVLVACYLMKLWECPPDYVINHLRIMRPVSIENPEQENVIYQFHRTIEPGFEHHYKKLEYKFSDQTQFLGKPAHECSNQSEFEPIARDLALN